MYCCCLEPYVSLHRRPSTKFVTACHIRLLLAKQRLSYDYCPVRSPSLSKLSAVSTMVSSRGRGCQPSMRLSRIHMRGVSGCTFLAGLSSNTGMACNSLVRMRAGQHMVHL